MGKNTLDPAVLKAKELFASSGKSLDELGQALGLEGDTARKGAWQLLNKVNDPKISTLRLLAKALGVPIEELVAEKKEHRIMAVQPRTREQAELGSAFDRIMCRLEELGVNPFRGKPWEDRRTGLKNMTKPELEQLEVALRPEMDSTAAMRATVGAITASRQKREGAK